MGNIDTARLALEAARNAGTVGRIAWDKLCLYYQVEAAISLLGMLGLYVLALRLLRLSFGHPFFGSSSEPTRHLWMWCAGVFALLLAVGTSIAQGSTWAAQVAVPEVRAAWAVAQLVRSDTPRPKGP